MFYYLLYLINKMHILLLNYFNNMYNNFPMIIFKIYFICFVVLQTHTKTYIQCLSIGTSGTWKLITASRLKLLIHLWNSLLRMLIWKKQHLKFKKEIFRKFFSFNRTFEKYFCIKYIFNVKCFVKEPFLRDILLKAICLKSTFLKENFLESIF